MHDCGLDPVLGKENAIEDSTEPTDKTEMQMTADKGLFVNHKFIEVNNCDNKRL